jgi:hypothetical protein
MVTIAGGILIAVAVLVALAVVIAIIAAIWEPIVLPALGVAFVLGAVWAMVWVFSTFGWAPLLLLPAAAFWPCVIWLLAKAARRLRLRQYRWFIF